MSENKVKTTTRVYKYGVVFDLPIARNFPETAINELHKSNQLWNNLVKIHRNNQEIYEQTRRDVSPDYRYLAEEIDRLNEAIDMAYKKDLRAAHLAASSRDKNHPLIRPVHEKIKDLKAQRGEVFKQIKGPRNEAKKLFDPKALEQDFWNEIKAACLIENSEIDANIANEIQRYFKTARSKALTDGGTLRFHGFDGTGFWHWRLRLSTKYAGRRVTANGVKWHELFAIQNGDELSTNLDTKQFMLLGKREIGKGKKNAVRARATLSGKGKKALDIEFDILLHRPIPENAQIQNVKLIRRRTGDQFKYHICFTVKIPEEPDKNNIYKLAVGIDPGFREEEARETRIDLREYMPLRVAYYAFSDPKRSGGNISVSKEMADKASLYNEIKSATDKSAAELEQRLLPLIKGVVIPEGYENKKGREKQIQAIINANRKSKTLSFEHTYKLAKWVRYDTEHGDQIFSKSLVTLLDVWLENNKHEYMGLHGLRRRLFLWRDEKFKIEASRLVKMAKQEKFIIAVENTKYERMIGVDKGTTDLSPQARANRMLAAPATFVSALKNAADRESVPFVKVPAQHTSKTCSNCHKVNRKLESEAEWICPSCGKEHDRDHNAAINIARLGLKIWNEQVEKQAGIAEKLY